MKKRTKMRINPVFTLKPAEPGNLRYFNTGQANLISRMIRHYQPLARLKIVEAGYKLVSSRRQVRRHRNGNSIGDDFAGIPQAGRISPVERRLVLLGEGLARFV